MKTIVSILGLLLFFQCLNSQQPGELEKSLDSLKILRDSYKQKIIEIENEYSRIEKILIQKHFEQSVGEFYICVAGTNIVKTPDKYEIVANLPINSKVKLLGQNDNYYNILYNDNTGWVIKAAIIPEVEFQARLKAKNDYNRKNLETVQTRKELLIKEYGTEVANKILDKKIWLGMTDSMARESWGPPLENNRTVGSWGIHEQWVYPKNKYLYFENGILTSWQD
jgi:hypothetical protein